MRLRQLELKDAPRMLEWMQNPSVVKYLKKDFQSMQLGDCEKFIRKADPGTDPESLHLAVVSDTDQYLGTVSLKDIDQRTHSAEFAITMHPDGMGNGSAREGMKEILRLGFEKLKLQTIYWCVSEENQRAVRFYDHGGYTRCGIQALRDRGIQPAGYTEQEIQEMLWYCAEPEEFIKKKPMVHILMSTWNGAPHIRRQIDSILCQTYREFRLFIRDDGSSDETVSIIKEYEKKDTRVILIQDTLGNLGIPESFYQIMRTCPCADYYAFSDQDDVWKKDKIQRAVKLLEESRRKSSESIPMLYVASHKYVREDGSLIRDFPKQNPNVRFDRTLYYSIASGFTMVFNEALRKLSIPEKKRCGELHDRRIQRVAAAFGRIVVDPACVAIHVRYQNSVTAEDADNCRLFRRWIHEELFGAEMQKEKRNLRDFMVQYGRYLKRQDYRTLLLFATNRQNLSVWFRKIFYPHRLRTRLGGEVALRLMFLTGRI